MATINLRDFYPWYSHDEFVDVPEVIAAELFSDRRYHKAHERRIKRNKAQYSLDANDGIEASAICHSVNSPEAVLEMMERHCRLCLALNSLRKYKAVGSRHITYSAKVRPKSQRPRAWQGFCQYFHPKGIGGNEKIFEKV